MRNELRAKRLRLGPTSLVAVADVIDYGEEMNKKQMNKNAPRPLSWSTLGLTVVLAVALSACGSGGGGSDDTPVAATPLTLNGTAATKEAIAGKTVEAKCNNGSGSATSNAGGAYIITIAGGSLPCLLRATADSGAVLHSLTQGTGSSATADITPVSQLVIARLTGVDPAAYYGSFDATAAGAVTAAGVQAAASAVVQQLKNSGVDFSAVGDVLTAALVPATATSAGNTYGQQLSALDAKLTSSSTTLAQLTTTVAASSPASKSSSAAVSLPADVLLRPQASNCSALRSGAYREITPTKGAPTIGDQLDTSTIDAVALTVLDAGATIATQLTPNGPCRYQFDSGTGDAVVSQAGVIIARFVDNGQPRLVLAFPQQTISVAELAGTWNFLGFELNATGTAYAADAGNATIGSDGVVSAISFCADVKTCTPINEAISIRANAAGGFDFVNTTANFTDRYFAYHAGGGELMLVGISGDGSFTVWTKKRTNTLPTVGTVTNNWNLTLNNQNLAGPALSEVSNTITSVDATSGTFIRTQQTVGANDAHPESLAINNPRDGYTFRPAATATAADGSTVVIREFTSLGLRGVGLSVLSLPSLGWYLFSVTQP